MFSGVADLKKAFEDGARAAGVPARRTLLFVDEIHRFNRAQQDGFLPFVEDGTVTLVGATTENPSFELNGALLSRCQVWCCAGWTMRRWTSCSRGPKAFEGRALPLDAEARDGLIAMADGDGRYLLNLAETLFAIGPATSRWIRQALAELLQQRSPALRQGPRGALQPHLRPA